MLRFFLLITIAIILAPISFGQTQVDALSLSPKPKELPEELKKLLPSLIAPLSTGWQNEANLSRERAAGSAKVIQLEQKLPRNPCRLTRKEIMSASMESTSAPDLPKIESKRRINFSHACSLDGEVQTIEARNLLALDLSLKELGPFYRLRVKITLTALTTGNNKVRVLRFRFADGRLERARLPEQTAIIFSGEYRIPVQWPHGERLGPGQGEFYWTDFLEKPRKENLLSLQLAPTEIP